MIEVQIDGGRDAFVPGDTLRGTLHWTAEASPDAVELRLLWTTEGRGDRDVGVVQRLRIEAPGPTGSSAFRFELPSGPWSCSGRLVSISWALEAVMDDDAVVRHELTLAPDGREIALHGASA